ncbi:BQ5605_C001g00547 [Microbotryum silenes-dioicae]|uniref:BQ5605_C001g00547 protein n=1 Tax=Microbotryum silenes-dioicae TaxID=796604 RepID=A0A2X0M7T2_9BASI|nr:BQ5605_C001g00547 [Microbotryum silenes-dioicae]
MFSSNTISSSEQYDAYHPSPAPPSRPLDAPAFANIDYPTYSLESGSQASAFPYHLPVLGSTASTGYPSNRPSCPADSAANRLHHLHRLLPDPLQLPMDEANTSSGVLQFSPNFSWKHPGNASITTFRRGSTVRPRPTKRPMGLLERFAARRAAVRPSSSAHTDQQCDRLARNNNNPTDLGIATRIRARRAAVQNGQRGQRHGRPEAERAPPRLTTTAIIALKPLKPHVSISEYLGPKTDECAHCKARHWECERSKSTRHVNTCWSRRARTPRVSRTRLIDPAEATDTRLGPDGADSCVQRSTLIKLESMLRAGNRSVGKFASAKGCVMRLCLPPGRDRHAHNLPTSSKEMAMLLCDTNTNMGDRGPQDLILQVHSDRCSDGRPEYQIFRPSWDANPQDREQIDNGVQLREVLVGLGLHEEDEEEGDEDEKKGTTRTVMVNVSVFGSYSSPLRRKHRADIEYRSTQQENLRITTAQGITDAGANGLTPDQTGRSVILGSTVKNSPREITQRYQDAMACVVKYGKPSLFIAMTCNPEWSETLAAQGRTTKHATVWISLHE